MICQDAKKTLNDLYGKDILLAQLPKEIADHISSCLKCREYYQSLCKLSTALQAMKTMEKTQYDLVKSDSREFNNKIWYKLKNRPKLRRMYFFWGELAVIFSLIVISLCQNYFVAKGSIYAIGIISLLIGTVYLNSKVGETYD